ncbi:SDR family oxidoreductase [Intrasporangium sp. DVR]|uniref:SDR family oxidoreductase n=1 Tax=Intrasporangium sp. DVR TaxID=3127867 RepID=UPI00313A5759
MTDLLMTGFPGFLGSALLPRLLARRPDSKAICLVQRHHLDTASERVRELAETAPLTFGRIELVEGDITEPGLGLSPEARASLDAVTEVWHLAAVYDLGVDHEVARAVNVAGTANVLDFCWSRPSPARLHHVSTCYVSGDHAGEFSEDTLDEGQSFRNHYESTKFTAELLVRQASTDGLPVTIYRPGIVVGDSATGETQKFDGPYYFARFLRRQGPVALVPRLSDPDRVRVYLVPRDFVVAAMDHLSQLEASVGRTYALADPQAPTAREIVDHFAHRLGRRVVWIPMLAGLTRAAMSAVPGAAWLLGLPAEAIDYFASRTTYSTTNTDRALADTDLACPPFPTYADRLIDYMLEHPDIPSKAMV